MFVTMLLRDVTVNAVMSEVWRWGVPVPLSSVLSAPPHSRAKIISRYSSLSQARRRVPWDAYSRRIHSKSNVSLIVSIGHLIPHARLLLIYGIQNSCYTTPILIAYIYSRAILRDEKLYLRPDMFDPERFMNEGQDPVKDPRNYIFGFGRRFVYG